MAPTPESAFAASVPFPSASARRRCSVETYSSWNFCAISKALSKTRVSDPEACASAEAPETLARRESDASSAEEIASGSAPSFARIGAGMGAGGRPCVARVLLIEERFQEVIGRELGMSHVASEPLRARDGILGLDGELVESHFDPKLRTLAY